MQNYNNGGFFCLFSSQINYINTILVNNLISENLFLFNVVFKSEYFPDSSLYRDLDVTKLNISRVDVLKLNLSRSYRINAS